MKAKFLSLALILVSTTMVSSCRVVDFTVISSKDVDVTFKKEVTRQKGVAFSVKAAMDKAIEKGGPGCDALVDGVIYNLPFFLWKVKGTPVKTIESTISNQ